MEITFLRYKKWLTHFILPKTKFWRIRLYGVMELVNDLRGFRDFFEKWVCFHKNLNIIIKYSTRDEYEVERERSWHYEHDRIGS